MTEEQTDLAQRPLTGVRVLALTHGMAGALATMMLADYGADVVLVEHRPDGLLRRTGGHSLWNRGKRSVALDLRDPDQRRIAADLAAGADIVVEDHRPGVMSGWGLGHDDVAAGNDAVVYTSISGYGQDTADRDRPGFDAAVAAHLGIMNEWGGSRDGPIFLGHPALDYATAMLATIGTLACLRSRIRTGRGDHVDVSLRDGALALYPMNWWTEDRETAIDEKSRSGDLRFGYKRLLLRMYECADGRLIQVHTGAAGAFDRAMEVFGLGDEISKMQGSVQMSSLLTDRDLQIMEERLPGHPAQPAERGVAAPAVGAPGRRPPRRRAGRGARRRPDPPRRRRRRPRRPRAGPDRGRRPDGAAVGDAGRDRLAGADVRRARRRDPCRRLAGGGTGDDAGRRRRRRRARPPAGRPAPRRLRHVLRLALRRPAAVGPRGRGDQGRGRRRRPDAPTARDVRGRQPRQDGDGRQPQARRRARARAGARRRRRRRAAQPPARRGRATRHRRRVVAPDRARAHLPLLPRLRLERAEGAAAELRPAAVGVRRAVRHRGRRRQPPTRHVRQRGLLQRPAGRLRLPARGRAPRAHRAGPGRREPAAALVAVHDVGVLQGRRRVPLGDPARRRQPLRLGHGLPAVPVPRRLDLRHVHRGRPGRRPGPGRPPARRARRPRRRASCGPIDPR